MADLSAATEAIWEAFNEEEAGVFVGYDDKLAAAIKALADQVVPANFQVTVVGRVQQRTRTEILAIAAELEGGIEWPTRPIQRLDDAPDGVVDG